MRRTLVQRPIFAFATVLLSAFLVSGCHKTITSNSAPVLKPLPGAAHPAYNITDTGPGEAYNLNASGQVAGMTITSAIPNSKGSRYFRGSFWDKGRCTELKTLDGRNSFTEAITDRGVITGISTVPGQTPQGMEIYHHCFWQNDKITDLERDPRFRGAGPLHLTKSGALYVVIRPQALTKQQHLWFYPAGFGPGVGHDLGVIGNGSLYVYAINDSGTVVGSEDQDGKHLIRHAFLWRHGHMTDLGTLGGASSEAMAINDAGQVVGDSDLAKNADPYQTTAHAFLWQQGKMHDLGTLPDGHVSHAYAINRQGNVVGYSLGLPTAAKPYLASQPVLWRRGRIVALIPLIPASTSWWVLDEARDINDHGQIIGLGHIIGDNRGHGYLLTPIGYNAGRDSTLPAAR